MKNILKKGLSLALAGLPLLGFAQQQKNVLFIAIDDLKPTIGAFNDNYAITPNIDKIADLGVAFINNHCQQAVCGPSRASLLTGQRPDRTKIWDLKTLIRDMNPNILTIPQHFKNSGYTSTGTGKIFDKRSVDNKSDGISWSDEFLFEGDEKLYNKNYEQPILHYYQDPETRALAEKYIKEAEGKGKKGYAVTKYVMERIKPSTESADVPDNAYVDGVITLTAQNKLNTLSKSEKPFFLAVGFKRPHLPFVAPKKYWDMYQRKEVPLAEYQKAAEGSPKFAYHNSGELRSYSDIPPLKSYSDIESDLLPEAKQRELIHGYYAAVSYIDAQVGKIMHTLDSLGLRENTVIVLWGDHGWHLGDHGIWCKHTNFEQATRAPLIFAGAGIKHSVNNSPTEFVDIFPTLCELSGIETPENLAGKSLVPILKGEKKSVKNYAVSQFHRGQRMGYAFRTKHYRYVVWMNDKFRSTQAFDSKLIAAQELYDYKKDPLETKNVFEDKDYAEIAKKMQSKSLKFFKNQELGNGKQATGKKGNKKKSAKNQYQLKKAENVSKYVAEKMNLNEEQVQFIHDAFLVKITTNSKETKGLSKEDKKPVYVKNGQIFDTKMKEKFDKAEIKQIKGYIREYNQKEKAKKNK